MRIGAICLLVRMDDAVKRFKPFYELLEPSTVKSRLTLAYRPTGGAKPNQNVNPGPECPMVSFTAR